MTDEKKKILMESLRSEFMYFMKKVASMPGSQVQKQAAFMRFDEGHMWMQNAIATYIDPKSANDSVQECEQVSNEQQPK